eukprot:TRINITY_DN71343_c0_g1_i1.p1 TRINITY_DN71343_c0_g1~~TRINITY_DN71343_c0_g1_i1.p1  ORF type:complete len:457 (+),score=63.67 TRINITY_DN71343_c0_g1_i1:51-1421(+)
MSTIASVGREFMLYVNFARGVERPPQAFGTPPLAPNVQFETYVRVFMERQCFQTELLQEAGRNPVFGFERMARWRGERLLEFEVVDVAYGGVESVLGKATLNITHVLEGDWEGDLIIYCGSKAAGKLNVGIEWLDPPQSGTGDTGDGPVRERAHAWDPPRREHSQHAQVAKRVPTPRGSDSRTDAALTPRSARHGQSSVQMPTDGNSFEDMRSSLAMVHDTDLRRYALRLSEVVVQLHQARREDWSAWRERETELLEEVVSSTRASKASMLANAERTRLTTELQEERRRRISAESRLTLDQQARKHIEATGSQTSRAYETEAYECQALYRKAVDATRMEMQLQSNLRNAENRAQMAQQEARREILEMSRKTKDQELRCEAAEAQALSRAWRLSGKLKSEMESWDDHQRGAVSTTRLRGGMDGSGPALTSSQAEQALHDLQAVRTRANDLLGRLPLR